MTVEDPTKVEIEILAAAIDRGWSAPGMPLTQLDFAVQMIQHAEPVYDADGKLEAWRGVALRTDLE